MIVFLDKREKTAMDTTMALLNRALSIQPAKYWNERYAISSGYLSDAKKRRHLSPSLAGNFAMDLGEDAKHWIAVAALETERTNPLNERLRESLLRTMSSVKPAVSV
jgi:hypothetical protein